MKLLVISLICFCILLYFSLGKTIPLIHVPSSSIPKYKSPPDYYSDTMAIQGVFSRTIEPMDNAPKLTATTLSSINSAPMDTGRQQALFDMKNPGGRSSLDAQNPQGSMDRFRRQNGSLDKSPEPQDGSNPRTRSHGEPSSVDTFRKNRSNPLLDTEPLSQSAGPAIYTCADTPYGCCEDGVRMRTSEGCPDYRFDMNGPGARSEWDKIFGGTVSFDRVLEGKTGLTEEQFEKLLKYSDVRENGLNSTQPAPASAGCMGSQYGCCPDNITFQNAYGTNCTQSPYPPSSPAIYILPIQGSMNDTGNSTQSSRCTQSTAPTSTSVQPTAATSSALPASSTMPYSSSFQPSPVQPSATTSNALPASSNMPYSSSFQPSPVQPTASPMDTVFLSPPNQPYMPQCPKPQPCPPCGRCPEPSFECKKVPNYSSDSNVLPVPVLTDFSQFGM